MSKRFDGFPSSPRAHGVQPARARPRASPPRAGASETTQNTLVAIQTQSARIETIAKGVAALNTFLPFNGTNPPMPRSRTTGCLPRCQCHTRTGTQCTRAAFRQPNGAYARFCKTHALCRTRLSKDDAQRVLAKRARSKSSSRRMRALMGLASETLRDLQTLPAPSRSSTTASRPSSSSPASKPSTSLKTPKARTKTPKAETRPRWR